MGEPCTAAGHTWTGDPLRCVSCGQVLNDPDPSTYSEAALRGLLHHADPPNTDEGAEAWVAAEEAGLVFEEYTPDGRYLVRIGATSRGLRLLEKAKAIADRIDDATDELLNKSRERSTPWGRLVGELRQETDR